MQAKKQKAYEWAFIVCCVVGIVCVGIIAWRGSRQERAHFSTQIGTTFQKVDLQNKLLLPYSWFVIDKPLAFNVNVKNVGNGSAYNVNLHFHSFIKPDISKASEQDAISDFEKWLTVQPKNSATWPKDYSEFVTAAGDGRLSPEDYSNLTNDRRTVFVVGEITFEDDFGSHELDLCEDIQPQVSFSVVSTQTKRNHLCAVDLGNM